MKKIVFIVSNLGGGGTQRVTLALANEFYNRGYAVDVLVCYSDIEKKFKVSKEINTVNVGFKRYIGNSVTKKISTYIFNLKLLRKAIKDSRPSAIIAQQFEQCIRVPLSLLFFKKLLICCEHSEYGRLNNFIRLGVNWYYKIFVRNLVVLTNKDKESYPVFLKNKINVLGNPLCLRNSQTIPDFTNKKENVILSVGRLSPEKGFYEYICFIAENKSLFKNWKVNIVGSGPEFTRLNKLIASNGLTHLVTILPFSNDIEFFYKKAVIYYLPSIKEGFGLVLLEAMEFGIPIIANSSSKGARTLIENSVNGLLVDNKTNTLAALNLLMGSYDERKRLVLNSRSTVQKYYVDNVVNDWEILIDNCKRSWF